MKFILLNPTFTKEPIEITNEKAIDQIKSRRRTLGLFIGDIVPVFTGFGELILKLVSADIDVSDSGNNVYKFENVKKSEVKTII